MRYRNAKKLHNGDEVSVKKTGLVQQVLTVERPDEKTILVYCDDGCTYHHREIM